jgi:hypothetical protein
MRNDEERRNERPAGAVVIRSTSVPANRHAPVDLRRLLPSTLGLFLLLAGCSPTKPGSLGVTNDGTTVRGTGTVNYYTLEGGFWAIRGDDNVTYDPINLSRSYWAQGLRVRFEAKLRNDLANIHMVGPIVEVLSISRL